MQPVFYKDQLRVKGFAGVRVVAGRELASFLCSELLGVGAHLSASNLVQQTEVHVGEGRDGSRDRRMDPVCYFK